MTSREEFRKYRSAAHKQEINIHDGTYSDVPDFEVHIRLGCSIDLLFTDDKLPEQKFETEMFGLKFIVFSSVLRSYCGRLIHGSYIPMDREVIALAANLQHGSAHVKLCQ